MYIVVPAGLTQTYGLKKMYISVAVWKLATHSYPQNKEDYEHDQWRDGHISVVNEDLP